MSVLCQHRKWAISFERRIGPGDERATGRSAPVRFVGSDWQACLEEASLMALAIDFALVVLGS